MELLIIEGMYDVAIPIWVMKDSLTFLCDSFVRGYHIYMNIWEPLVGECLKSRKDPTNEMDKTAVAVIRINSYGEGVAVGHLPKNMSKIAFMFLSLPPLGFGHLCNWEMHQSWRWIQTGNSS